MEIDQDEYFTDEFLETSCLADDECAQELLRDAPAGCLYCALSELQDDDD